MNKYPIYVISKGRWDSRMTSKALEVMKVPYHIVIEPQEYKKYVKHIDSSKIIVLPFSNLGQGSIPARNFVWEHAISRRAKRHWILDDNIDGFYRLNHNLKIRVTSSAIFKATEDFIDRYTNVGLAGFNYDYFCKTTDPVPPYYLNTRIYSCILINNSLEQRWRGIYNEDTDLSIRVLKDKWCTILINAFLADKTPTMQMKGGNTDELYKDDGRLKMAKSLEEQHPDIVKVVWKFNKWHHQVNYSKFKKNKLILKENVVIPNCVNEYGMKLIKIH